MTFKIFKVISLVLILLILFIYLWKLKKSGEKVTKLQLIIASVQLVICSYFFALCVSDFFEISKHFSLERLVADIFCDIAFLVLIIYILFYNRKEEGYFKIVLWAAINFIGVQSFVVPYRSEFSLMKIFETIEGAVVYGILIAMVLNLRSASFCKKCIFIVIALEMIISILNVFIPIKSVEVEYHSIDIFINLQALFVRPVLFGSIALAYFAWIDRHKDLIETKKN